MENSAFDQIEQALKSRGAEATFDYLIQRFLEEKDYARIFQTRLLKKRFELGLPLIHRDLFDGLAPDQRKTYEEAFVQAARETGELFLADGDIPRAWSYFRAIGETSPIAAAIEKIDQHENMAAIIEIAFHEQAHPRKGFELILNHYGICRAISSVFQYPAGQGREDCIGLLLRTVHHDLLANLKRTISQREGQAPETSNLAELLVGRDWLFEDNCYYIDTSHVVSVIQYSLEVSRREPLELALQLAEYGTHLGPMFQQTGNPPFERFEDYAFYLRALLGREPEAALAHFRAKVSQSDPSEVGTAPAQALVTLLARLERYDEAIAISLVHLKGVDPSQLACPSVQQLCQAGKDFAQLREISREQGDPIGFAAAVLQARPTD
jgi:hypothetical protein